MHVLKLWDVSFFLPVSFFFLLFCLFSWNGIWESLRRSSCGHNWKFPFPYPFCNHWNRALIRICIYIILVFLPKHCSLQNSSAKERILGYWVALCYVRETDLLLITHLYLMVQGNEPSGLCLFCSLLCAVLLVESGGYSSGVKEKFHVLDQISSSIIAAAEGLWLVVT